MQVFLTGATGFIGANLARLLCDRGCTVRALVRPGSSRVALQGLNLELVAGDLLAPNLAELMQGCQALFHVAAHYSLWQRDRAALHSSNVLGTRHILAAARAAGVERTVYTSSVAAIGVRPGGQPADETYQSPPDQLIGAYKQSKYWAEQVAHAAVAAGQDLVIVNPSTPIGPWDCKPTPTGATILRFLRGQMPAYVNTGLNFIDVRDVAAGHWLAWQKGQTGDRYILGGQNWTLAEFLQQLAAATGHPAPQRQVPLWLPLAVAWVDERLLAPLGKQPSVPLDGVRMAAQAMYYDASKARRELGLPQSSLPEAVRAAVHWFQTAPASPLRRGDRA
ncbi:MAG: NAD-dependent epimerase/dehydratase family protein [Spirulinaceae cyanobacterium SM2_1_0]|nr:NAD-dependent epimerase/dehydratase family protein [Spirulinaceae cyanobacterium SM2_1_0]